MDDANYWSETEGLEPGAVQNRGAERKAPEVIGRYRVVHLLGRGGFGRVYLAHDGDLDRPVAIKVPSPERVSGPVDVQLYVDEAKALAKLSHPNIVPVYDVGRTDDGLCYVVSKYIDGSDLAHRLQQGRLTIGETVELTAIVAQALHHAHTRGLVHRDIKPGNILIDASGAPWVADFGLALKDEDYGKGARLAGTPSYMSPEQARGEGHRVDGRSDIFSLGVVFYELLAGRKPFRGESRSEIMDQVAICDPRPLRQIDDTIPRELERICQKALAKRAPDRYDTGRDLAEDLRYFLAATPASTPASLPPSVVPSTIGPPPTSTQEATPQPTNSARSDTDSRPIKIVPKGLRSFDRHDADFFVELLPGPRDREDLPSSLRLWKMRIESADADSTFRVGMIYGPSGCGKSSWVKAGLLPHLADDVLALYVEATPTETEARVLRRLQKSCPDLKTGLDLVESFAALRRGHVLRQKQKVLLVLDQFEQWLFGSHDQSNSELVAALRQCDGVHTQAIVMVRDDFWMAATRFMRDLEIRLVEGENSAAVDLFDIRHARKVLAAFGRAYGVLPEKSSEVTANQRAFLDQSVAGLAQDGKVVSVRLALFAEMVKGKAWTPATLKEVGGTQGVGVTFLEETFTLSTAPPEHRLHQRAAQSVLKALLPQAGTDIKGQMQSEAKLRESSDYASRPRDFDDLIGILDGELRLITPTDPDGSTGDLVAVTRPVERYYQLTHDYLVPSLRDWLSRKQRESRRGRAELRLAERAAIWESKPENRHLPSLAEWATIRTLTRTNEWSESQRQVMNRASRTHGWRALGAAVILFLIGWAGIEVYGNFKASALVDSLMTATPSDVPSIVGRIANYRRWADPRLRSVLESSDRGSRVKLNASLALLPIDRSQLSFLGQSLLNASPAEFVVLRGALTRYRDELNPKLWEIVERDQPTADQLLRAAGALALYDPDNPKWGTVASKLAQALVTINPVHLGAWIDPLRPIRNRLSGPLAAIVRDRGRPESEHSIASNLLADYASDNPELLAAVLVTGGSAFRALFPVVQAHGEHALPLLRATLKSSIEGDDDEEKNRLAEQQARAAIALIRLGQVDEVRPRLLHSPDPRLRSYIVNWLKPLGVDPMLVASEFDRPLPSFAAVTTNDVLFDKNISIRRALILALGTYSPTEFPTDTREATFNKLADLYQNDPDAGIHGAAEFTLRRWNQEARLKTMELELSRATDRGERRWFVDREGRTFAVVDGPVEFLMGSPDGETERKSDREAQHRVVLRHRFAITTKEVTVEHFQRFLRTVPKSRYELPSADDLKLTSYPNGPWICPSWFMAVHYCNWLSEQEGLPEDQWCYQPKKGGLYEDGMTVVEGAQKRRGYRLPTEAEWESACRAGTVSSRYYGSSKELLGQYAWFRDNSKERVWKVGSLLPNDLGLFDMLGNVHEWCHDRGEAYKNDAGQAIMKAETVTDGAGHNRTLRGGAFYMGASEARSADRAFDRPSGVSTLYGVRLARTLP